MTIAPRATSLPVPAVVGTAISGATRSLMRVLPPSMVALVVSGPGWVAAIAGLVYEWLGVAFLRRGWINLDRIWVAALAATGLFLIL